MDIGIAGCCLSAGFHVPESAHSLLDLIGSLDHDERDSPPVGVSKLTVETIFVCGVQLNRDPLSSNRFGSPLGVAHRLRGEHRYQHLRRR